MDDDLFWTLIEKTHQQSGRWNLKLQCELLVEELLHFSAEEIIAFDLIGREMERKSYSAHLWHAAELIGGGCGDDGFNDFRDWIIAQGRVVFENALTDPETLVDVIEPKKRYEICSDANGTVLYAPLEAYERKMGHQMPPSRFSPELIGKFREDLNSEEDWHRVFSRLAAVFNP
jgi:hypothetical protein